MQLHYFKLTSHHWQFAFSVISSALCGSRHLGCSINIDTIDIRHCYSQFRVF